jgi:hypothetical protein
MKDILYELAMPYKVMNPIRGIVPGSPCRLNFTTELSDDDINKK